MEQIKKLKAWMPALVMVITFFAWSWGIDWVQVEDWTRNGKMLFAVAGIALMAAVYTCRQFHWSVGLFLGYTLLRWVSLRMAPVCLVEVTMVTACIFAAIFVHHFDNKKLLANCLAIDAFLQASLGLIEVVGYFPILKIKPEMADMVWAPLGMHGNPTVLGPYLAVSLAFIPEAFGVVKNATHRFYIQLFAALIIFTCIAFTQSTMAYGTLAVVVMLAIGFYLGLGAMLKSAGVVAAVGLAVIFFHPAFGSASGRIPQWDFAMKNATPMGHGPGTWKPVKIQILVNEWRAYEEAVAEGKDPPRPARQLWDTAHNDPIQGVFEWGWLGMAPLFAGLIVLTTIIWKAIRERRRELFPFAALFAGLLADSCGNFILHTMPAGGLFAIGAIYLFRYDFEAEAICIHLRSLEEGQKLLDWLEKKR